MLEETISRVDTFCTKGVKPLIITGKTIAGKFKTVLPQKLKYDLIIEPVGKNTAPAVALAASYVQKKYGDAVMVVLSADHDIRPKKAFVDAIKYAVKIAQQRNELVVFGIKPTRAETGYGYIQLGKKIDASDSTYSYSVKRFIEKPNQEKAKRFLNSDKHMWNSGMFIWKTSVILEEFAQYMPDLFKQVQKLSSDGFTKNNIDSFYAQCQKESIDFGIMEHSQRVSAVIGDFKWDDIGSWESVKRIHGQNDSQTTVVGTKVYEKESCGSTIVNKSSLAIASIGLKDVVIVATDDAILAIDRAKLSDFKKYLNEMKSVGNLPANLF